MAPRISAKGPDPGKRGIQTILFQKESWTRSQAEAWLRDHEFRSDAYDEAENVHRFRQFNPSACDPDSYQTLTEDFPAGVSAVTCIGKSRSADPDPTWARPGTSRAVKDWRALGPDLAEIRVLDAEGVPPRIAGHAARFDVPSLDLGFGREIVRRSAFTKTLDEADPVSLWDHKPELIMGRRSAGTLELQVDELGLWFASDVPEADPGPYWLESVRKRNVTGASFSFFTVRDRWSQDENGITTRELLEVRLEDVSPTAFPAYPQTDVFVRSMMAAAEGVDPSVVRDALERRDLTTPEIRASVMRTAGGWLPDPDRSDTPALDPLAMEKRRLELLELEG